MKSLGETESTSIEDFVRRATRWRRLLFSAWVRRSCAAHRTGRGHRGGTCPFQRPALVLAGEGDAASSSVHEGTVGGIAPHSDVSIPFDPMTVELVS